MLRGMEVIEQKINNLIIACNIEGNVNYVNDIHMNVIEGCIEAVI